MRLLVLGATGRVGGLVVDEALKRGHYVTVLVRSLEKLGDALGAVKVVRGDALDARAVASAVAQQDAVLCVLGAGNVRKTTLFSESARILLDPTEDEALAVEGLIEDRVVFYGAFFHGAADAMNTPLHNDLPAVFLHAQTFDNLVTLGADAVRHVEREVPLLGVSLPDFLVLVAIGGLFTLRRTSRRFEEGWTRMMRRVRSRLGRVVLVALGSQIGMLIVLAGFASLFACYVGASEWVLGVNFLFAVTWTEVLDITEKLFEAADELGPE